MNFFHYHLVPLYSPTSSNHHTAVQSKRPFSFLLNISTPNLPLPLAVVCSPSMSQSLFFLLVQFFSRFHKWMKSYGICLSLTGLFHLPLCSPDPSILLQRVKFSSFIWLSSIPLCKCPIVVLSTHLMMVTWAASICWWF